MRILLIDDDVELAGLLDQFLQREGFTVEFAHEGRGGLKMALHGQFHLGGRPPELAGRRAASGNARRRRSLVAKAGPAAPRYPRSGSGGRLHVQTTEKNAAILAGDPALLRRAVENVIRNAIRCSPAGTTVAVSIDSSPDQVAVTVRDFGPGVPEEAVTRISDPFYRAGADRNRNNGGVGLGVAIARRAVELRKGRLWAINAAPSLTVKMEMPVSTVTSPALLRSLAG